MDKHLFWKNQPIDSVKLNDLTKKQKDLLISNQDIFELIKEKIFYPLEDIIKKAEINIPYEFKKIKIDISLLLSEKSKIESQLLLKNTNKDSIFKTNLINRIKLTASGGTGKLENTKLKLLINYILSHLISLKK